MNEKGYWLAFSIGVAAGAAVALLYAPQTGVSARKKIRSSLEDAGDYVSDAGDYLKSQAEKLSSEAQTLAERSKGQVSDAVDSAVDYAGSAAKQVRSLV